MARQYISYGMEAMFVGPSGAMQTPSDASSVAKLDFIQSYDFSFDVDRAALKQIGSSYLATRQTQLAPDVNLNLQYYLNRGWNEKFIGMDVGITDNGYKNPFSTIFTSNQDRNFYIVIAQDNGKDLNADTSFDGHNILGIGNIYLTNYELSVGLNSLATVNLSFVGANAEISQVSSATFQNPALFVTGSGTEVTSNQSIGILDDSRSSRYMTGYSGLFAGGCPHGGCQITATAEASNALKLGFDFDNFQSLSISVPIERKALYGFGNNHPFNRKVQKPIVGNLSIDSLVDSFTAENLATTFQQEDVSISGYFFDIVFSNQANVKKFGVKVNNARLDSYSIGSTIGDRSVISTSWSFEVNESTGILMSGSYTPTAQTAGFITEANGRNPLIQGTAAPIFGSSAATYNTSSDNAPSNAGWTLIVSATQDDNFFGLNALHNINIYGVSYNTIYPGSNTYITMSAGSSTYNFLNFTNPPLPAIQLGSADNSWQRVWIKNENNKTRIRCEGTNFSTGTPGAPNIVYEITFFKADAFFQYIEIRFGVHGRTGGVFGIQNGIGSYVNGGTITQNQSYVIRTDTNGNNPTIFAGHYVLT